MPVFDGLDEALRWIRLHRKLKQREVAQAAGITQAMLCSYEQGKRQPSLRTLERVLDSLDVSLGELGDVLASLGSDRPAPPQDDRPGEGGAPARRMAASGGREQPLPPPPALDPLGGGAVDGLSGSEDQDLFEELPQLDRLLGLEEPLSQEEDAALRQLVGGFCRWLRVLHLSSRRVKG